MMFLHTLDTLLEHIKSVESETIDLTKKAQLKFVQLIERNGILPDDETLETMQYQDIISQQLSATIEAIESVQENIKHFLRSLSESDADTAESIDKMESRLTGALEKAKERHSAFGGKLHQDDNGIEFF
ncbi:MAG: hypothetical protein M0P91_01500 [Sulfuricurvum sp.]|jgi:hypothetical protein|uniref:hypothetical protein n=1 Tax=Sulfuricurvum sp. TaxID=2025608 RepID=UPI0025F68D24|nr:hypothetical protein [Sulfuricurvum sp.]MCK9371845.1 hypothetical protein [Sulfuricurvum sp.]